MHGARELHGTRELLAAWNVLEVYPLLRDEGIDVEELKMMRYHHMVELLQGARMGVRIRFEHELELWRRQQDLPPLLAAATPAGQRAWPLWTNSAVDVGPRPPPRTRTLSNSTDDGGAIASALTNGGHGHGDDERPLALSPTSVGAMPPLHPLPSHRRTSTHAPARATAEPTAMVTRAAQKRPAASPAEEEYGVGAAAHEPEAALAPDPSTISVLSILRESSKGKTILDQYSTHGHLTAAHRTLLVALIANHFDNHDLHLSLHMSHQLEEQILGLFPNERLEFYRTEKRGKLYVKFSNMKRYRRDRLMVAKRKSTDDAALPNDHDEAAAGGCASESGAGGGVGEGCEGGGGGGGGGEKAANASETHGDMAHWWFKEELITPDD